MKARVTISNDSVKRVMWADPGLARVRAGVAGYRRLFDHGYEPKV